MQLVDANVLLYAVNEAAEHHAKARTWLDGALAAREPVGFAWSVLLAFLRLSTHPAVFPRPLTASEATGVVRAWLAQPPVVVVEPTARHLDVLAGLLAEAGTQRTSSTTRTSPRSPSSTMPSSSPSTRTSGASRACGERCRAPEIARPPGPTRPPA